MYQLNLIELVYIDGRRIPTSSRGGSFFFYSTLCVHVRRGQQVQEKRIKEIHWHLQGPVCTENARVELTLLRLTLWRRLIYTIWSAGGRCAQAESIQTQRRISIFPFQAICYVVMCKVQRFNLTSCGGCYRRIRLRYEASWISCSYA